MAKHAAPLSIFSWAFLAIGMILFALAGIGWSNHLSEAGEVVARNVSYAGLNVTGMTPAEVEDQVAGRADELLSTELTIDFGAGELALPLAEIGFDYDQQATTEGIIGARYQGSAWDQFSAWAVSGLATSKVEDHWSFDAERAREVLDDHPGLIPVPMVEPGVSVSPTGLELVPGQIGSQADIEATVEQLAEVDLTAPPDRVTVVPVPVEPTVGDDRVQVVVDRLNEQLGQGVDVSVNGRKATLTPRVLFSHLIVGIGDGSVDVAFDGAGLQETLETTFVGPVGDFLEPVMVVEGEEIEVVATGDPPPVCCQEDIGEWLGDELLAGATGPFSVPDRPSDDPALVGWADGRFVVDKVSEFTTPHACCESRVDNIQRMADLVRGVYLIPGERFSLNEFVGPRTRENGFVAAGAIRQGHLISEVGGGVSQFATTIFNAAYFAGMDFEEYRSHTIYFSRYPYGREATISNPAPDLIMLNTTEYPILIWTSYTDTSITVSMYSTKHIDVTDVDQRTSRRGVCTHVETDRQRTYPDGREIVDTFLADYRPAEGIDCSGNRIPEPGD